MIANAANTPITIPAIAPDDIDLLEFFAPPVALVLEEELDGEELDEDDELELDEEEEVEVELDELDAVEVDDELGVEVEEGLLLPADDTDFPDMV